MDCCCQAANAVVSGLNNVNQGGGFGQGLGNVIGGVIGGGFGGVATNYIMTKFNSMQSQISTLQNGRALDKAPTEIKPK
jgi:outer membrane lipoprotein SlyB